MPSYKDEKKRCIEHNVVPYFKDKPINEIMPGDVRKWQNMLIAERIGDTVNLVNTTYGHLYPNRHEEVADKLDQIVSY